jgi:hypothetical protein
VKITLVSEGTYPYAMGGVSIWCEQLIKGMPDYRWDVVALTVDGAERSVFPAHCGASCTFEWCGDETSSSSCSATW